jgi:hypothetical protein
MEKAMMDDRNDINRPLGSDPYVNQRPRVPERRSGWTIPLVIAALLIVGGFLFYNTSNHGPDRTASNNAPAVTQTNPSGPERTSPVPSPTPAR